MSTICSDLSLTYANITLAEHREREWQKQATKNGESDKASEVDYEDQRHEPLAIEAPPAAPPVDLRQMTGSNNASQPQYAYSPQQQHYQQQPYDQSYAAQQQGQNPYPPQQQPWQNTDYARNTAEAMAATAPGQPVLNHQQQQQHQSEFNNGSYSQNV